MSDGRATAWQRARALAAHPHRAVELVRYGAIGALNAGTYFGLYAAGVLAGVPYWASAVVAFVLSASLGYWLHEHYTFRGRRPSMAGLLKWIGAQSGATGVNLALLAVAVHWLDAQEILAQLVLMPVMPAVTYILGKRWVFTRAEHEAPAVPAPAASERAELRDELLADA